MKLFVRDLTVIDSSYLCERRGMVGESWLVDIEMSGERMAFVLRWGVDSRGAFRQERSLVFPLLRTLPNNTHASLMYRMAADIPSLLGVNGLALQTNGSGRWPSTVRWRYGASGAWAR